MKYTVKKIAGLIITLLIVSMLAFLAFELIPGDPARSILGTEATESKVQALREEDGTQPSPAAAIWTVGERLCDRRYGNLLFLSGAGKRLDRR